MFHFETCQFVGLLAEMPRPVWAPWLAAKGSVLSTMILLFAGHALCDFPWQGEFISHFKSHKKVAEYEIPWWQILFAHSIIHSGMVLFITGSTTLALLELVIHFTTDWAKCDGRISFNQDQGIHYACKVIWAVVTTL